MRESYKTRILKLTPWLVRAVLPPNVIGTYVLYETRNGISVPCYIGRSNNLRERLSKHPYLGIAHHFEYFLQDSEEKAFVSECSLYHNLYDSSLNKIHPATPKGSLLKCPFCINHADYRIAV